MSVAKKRRRKTYKVVVEFTSHDDVRVDLAKLPEDLDATVKALRRAADYIAGLPAIVRMLKKRGKSF